MSRVPSGPDQEPFRQYARVVKTNTSVSKHQLFHSFSAAVTPSPCLRPPFLGHSLSLFPVALNALQRLWWVALIEWAQACVGVGLAPASVWPTVFLTLWREWAWPPFWVLKVAAAFSATSSASWRCKVCNNFVHEAKVKKKREKNRQWKGEGYAD